MAALVLHVEIEENRCDRDPSDKSDSNQLATPVVYWTEGSYQLSAEAAKTPAAPDQTRFARPSRRVIAWLPPAPPAVDSWRALGYP